MTIDSLPPVNAAFNASSALLLVIGYILIRTGRWRAHAGVMIAALVTSAAFLTCYLILHASRPPRSFTIHGPIRPVYFALLITHVVLAAAIVPLATMMVVKAIRRRWQGHRRLGKWALPVWLYVSVTGVVIYWMLYRW